MKRRVRENFRRRRITVVGMGESGAGAVKLLLKAGAAPRVSTDSKLTPALRSCLRRSGVPFEEGGHTRAFFAGSWAVVTSPGVRPSSPVFGWARAAGVPVWSELEFASRFLRGTWAAVTGTNGKTTTVTLLAAMAARAADCDLCGNVGRSLSRSIVERGPRMTRVVEASSFQLYFTDRFRPTVAVILNLAPNHLDWHSGPREYYRSKLNIARRLEAGEPLVLNADDPTLARLARGLRCRKVLCSLSPVRDGVYRDGVWVMRARAGVARPLARLDRMRLRGDHNVRNVMAAAAAALELGVSPAGIQRAIDAFRPLEHRTEELGEIAGVRFVNDSKSTSSDSARAALESFEGPIVLIAGGRPKQKDFSALRPIARRNVALAVLYGEARRAIAAGIGVRNVLVKRFATAVRRAFRAARRADTVLLSPMCASFDQFASYEERGREFKKIFRELKRRHGSDA